MSRAQLRLLLLAGLLVRLLALPLPGTGDVVIWKTWSANAVASGESTLYGVGGRPQAPRELESIGGGARFKVDYPPLSLYALGAAGRLYRAWAPGLPDSTAFTACVKLPSLLAEIGLAWVVFAGVRRFAGTSAARRAMLACWLNPALLLNGSVLGYLDPLILFTAVAAVFSAAAGRTWLTGALCAAAALTKPQGVLVVPAVAVGVVGLTWARRERLTERLALRAGETAAGALVVALAVAVPFARAGALPNLAVALRSLAEQDMLSGNAANLWWVVTWILRALDGVGEVGAWRAFTSLPRILAVSDVMALGYPDARKVGFVLLACAWLWGLWRARNARDPWLLAGLGAFLVHAYFVLAANVHENHLLLALPLAVVAGVGRPRWGALAVALTAIHFLNLNLFYGFGEVLRPNLALPRAVTIVDAAVVLALLNLLALGWHARVLLDETRLFSSLASKAPA